MTASGATFTTLAPGRYWFVKSGAEVHVAGEVKGVAEQTHVGGIATVTGATLDINTGLSTVEGAVVSINEAPGASSGDVYTATVTWSGHNITVSIWQDGSEVATEDTSISWVAFGQE